MSGIPVLPAEIAETLPEGTPGEDAATDAQVKAFLTEHVGNTAPGKLQGLIKALSKRFATGDSRHMSTVPVTAGAMKEARLGLYPAKTAVDTLKAMFLAEVAKDPASAKQGTARTGAVAESEFNGILSWAVGQALAADLDEVRARVDEKMPDNWAWMDELGAASTNGHAPPAAEPIRLDEARATFRRWFGDDYDTDALDAMLAAVAVERFDDGSDTVWLLLVSGPGAAKTETVQALDGVNTTTNPTLVVSCISSEAALLSGTSKRDRAKAATGGLLRRIGGRGVLVVKDVTTILAMDRNTRGNVLAALREVYDGRWSREVGTDGGRFIEWRGRIVVVGAVTTAWDTAHAVVATMGDRFVLCRIDSTIHRQNAGRKAIRNTGDELEMRAELAAATAGVIAGMSTEPTTLTEEETDVLLAAADLVTLARTGVEFDYRGDVIDAHAPEMPTRFAKQLAQIVRGSVAIGMARGDALRLALRCARDSMPPMRLAIIDDLALNPGSTPSAVAWRIDKPRTTVKRQLQALQMLGIAIVTGEEEDDDPRNRKPVYYSLASHIDPGAIKTALVV